MQQLSALESALTQNKCSLFALQNVCDSQASQLLQSQADNLLSKVINE